VTKKVYLIIAALIILLYAAIVLKESKVIELGELFGYLYYVIIIFGIVAGIWLFIKPPKKE